MRKRQLAPPDEVRRLDEAGFAAAAQTAKEGCPVSKLYKTEIVLTAKLEN